MSLFGLNIPNLSIDLSDLTTGLPTTTTNVTSVSPYESGAAASSFYGSFPDTTEERQPLDWWDVEDPAAYFGVKGERTEEQQARARQFREEWGNVRGGAVLNGLIDGTYTADQVNQYWGAENFSSQIKASDYSTGEFSGNPDDFGAYLQAEWDAVSGFLEGTAGGPSGELGSLTTAPTQGLGGAQGQGRGVRVTTDVLAQQNYVNSIRAAASDAGVPTNVISPDGAHYELNFGQFDDVGLGEYKQTKEPYGTLDIAAQIFGEVIKAVLTTAVTGEVIGALSDLAGISGAATSSSGVMTFSDAAATGEILVDNQEIITTLLDVVTSPNVINTINSEIDSLPEATVPENVVIPEDTDTQDPYLTEDYVRGVFEDRGYEATDKEIENIINNSRVNDLSGASDGSKEIVLSGEIRDVVNANTVNVKDLYRIFNAELGRRPTDEEVEQILGEGGRRATVQGSEDIVYDFIEGIGSSEEELDAAAEELTNGDSDLTGNGEDLLDADADDLFTETVVGGERRNRRRRRFLNYGTGS